VTRKKKNDGRGILSVGGIRASARAEEIVRERKGKNAEFLERRARFVKKEGTIRVGRPVLGITRNTFGRH